MHHTEQQNKKNMFTWTPGLRQCPILWRPLDTCGQRIQYDNKMWPDCSWLFVSVLRLIWSMANVSRLCFTSPIKVIKVETLKRFHH